MLAAKLGKIKADRNAKLDGMWNGRDELVYLRLGNI